MARPYHEVSREDVAPNEWVFEQPFFLLLNVAVGGNLGGPVFPDTVFPGADAGGPRPSLPAGAGMMLRRLIDRTRPTATLVPSQSAR